MINHPMLLMRDPPPILDVTRPALPKYRPFSQRYGYTDAEGKITAADQFKAGVIVRGDRIMVIDSKALFLPCPGIFETENVVMFSAYPPDANPLTDMYCWMFERFWFRRPTDAELAEHWPEDAP